MSPASRALAPERFARFRRWRSSWRLVLRLATRESRSHRGRNALIRVMVGLPVLLIGIAVTWWSTTEISAEESLSSQLGAAEAKIMPISGGGRVMQLPDAVTYRSESSSEQWPGHRPGTAWTANQLTELTGRPVTQVAYSSLYLSTDARLTALSALSVDDPASTGLTRLVGGRWPQNPGEVAVTAAGVAKGAPAAGKITLRSAADESVRTVSVVGTVVGMDPDRRPLDLLTAYLPTSTPTDGDTAGSFLVLGSPPVTWPDVQRWNTSGLLVLSREVVQHPPPIGEQPREVYQQKLQDRGVIVGIVALISVGLLLETTLLAGPAFAVGAARQRRALALVASNGAERAQLRRYLLSQALIFGAAAALAGAVLAVGFGWLAARTELWLEPTASVGPFDVPWLALVALVAAATASAMVAALIPARGASRINIADVLAGRERSLPLGRGLPLAGAALVVVSAGVLLARIVLRPGGDLGLATASAFAGLVVGVTLLVPALLTLLGRAAGGLPIGARLPVRDAARQRSRSVPAVAAVIVTVATMTILVVANTSDDRQQRRDYQTERIAGHGYFYGESRPEAALSEIRREHPDWVVHEHGVLGIAQVPGGTERATVVSLVPQGCTPLQAVSGGMSGDHPESDRCARIGSNGEAIGVVGAADAAVGRVDPEAAAVLARGGILVGDPDAVSKGRSTLVVGGYEPTETGAPRVERTVSVPAAVVPPQTLLAALRESTNGGQLSQLSAVMSLEAARRWSLPLQVNQFEVVDPTGPISTSDQRALDDGNERALEVERGYQSAVGTLVWVLIGLAGALILVAALVATALAQVEGRGDLATLAALGAAVSFRRRLAAGQAVLVAGTGALLGVLAGLLPGAVAALTFTTSPDLDGTILPGFVRVPWLQLGMVLVGVPLLAASVAALAVRRIPTMTRRLG